MTHAKQLADWNGRSGQRWLTYEQRLDAMLDDYGAAALAAAAPMPGEQVLDIGCGSGQSTLELARSVGRDGHVTGVDISEPLLARARERAAEAGLAVDFRLADASTDDFAPGQTDLLFSRFGLMFFDDPVAAFAHLRCALREGGRLATAVWRGIGDNLWARLVVEALGDIVPVPPLASFEVAGPFSFAEPGRVECLLHEAGFREVALEPFDSPLLFGIGADDMAAAEDALAQAGHLGPLRRLLAKQEGEVRARAEDAVRAAFRRHADGGRVSLPGGAWIVTARR